MAVYEFLVNPFDFLFSLPTILVNVDTVVFQPCKPSAYHSQQYVMMECYEM